METVIETACVVYLNALLFFTHSVGHVRTEEKAILFFFLKAILLFPQFFEQHHDHAGRKRNVSRINENWSGPVLIFAPMFVQIFSHFCKILNTGTGIKPKNLGGIKIHNRPRGKLQNIIIFGVTKLCFWYPAFYRCLQVRVYDPLRRPDHATETQGSAHLRYPYGNSKR